MSVYYATLTWSAGFDEGGQVWEGFSDNPDYLLDLLQEGMKPIAESWKARNAVEGLSRKPEMAWEFDAGDCSYYAVFGTLKLRTPGDKPA